MFVTKYFVFVGIILLCVDCFLFASVVLFLLSLSVIVLFVLFSLFGKKMYKSLNVFIIVFTAYVR